MKRRVLTVVAVCACLVFAAGKGAYAEALTDAETKRIEELVKQLGDADAARAAAAETELRNLGAKALPALSKATVAGEGATTRLRTIVVDLTVDSARIDPTDANTLSLVGREEALAKRWPLAAKCYRRAEKLYDRLADDAGDRKEKAKKREYEDLRDKAEKRADKAERLAKGEKFTGLNLGIVRVGVEHDNTDADW
jgi:hypothetical protein